MNKLSILIILLLCMSCCTSRKHSEKLTEIDDMCDTYPVIALSMLDSIEYHSLSENERHHYDLIKIKANDKAYINHLSDSLIVDVIYYYTNHQDNYLYPLSLYYGGRVYSDLGDYPKAIAYFENSLHQIDKDSDNIRLIRLRSNVLSQLGRLLHDINRPLKAIPYIKESIKLSMQLKDSIGTAYDDILLSEIYLNQKDSKSARFYLNHALRFSRVLSSSDKAWIHVILASVLLMENKIDSALNMIRPQITLVDSLCYNFTLANAAEIYLHAGKEDSAYMFAKELALSRIDNNRNAGYNILISDKLDHIMSKDSLRSFLRKYNREINRTNDTKHARLYETLELNNTNRNNIQFYKKNHDRFITCLIIFTILLALSGLSYLYLKLHKFHNKLLNIQQNKSYESEPLDINVSHEIELIKNQQKVLLDKIQNRIKDDYNYNVPETILQSSTYKMIKRHLAEKKVLTNYSNWKEIEKMVNSTFPNFLEDLRTLCCNKLTITDIQTALLIKCGLSPSELAVLCSVTKSTITSRRSKLSFLIFNDNKSIRQLDDVIHAL